jgi:hypothetical protein
VTSNWRLLEEPPKSRTGLSLALVPTTLVQDEKSQTQIFRPDRCPSTIGNQILLASLLPRGKVVAIGPEVTIPSDSRPQAFTEAYDRKIKCYGPLRLTAALQGYVDSGWDVYVLPWVVGARGMAQRDQLIQALEFLEISK